MKYIYINDHDLVIESYAYANDCTTYDKNQLNEVERIMQQRLTSITAWGQLWQVTFAAEKTQMMHIAQRLKDCTLRLSISNIK